MSTRSKAKPDRHTTLSHKQADERNATKISRGKHIRDRGQKQKLKKGGGGGKFTVGKAGIDDLIPEGGLVLDKADPNYDSEEERLKDAVFVSAPGTEDDSVFDLDRESSLLASPQRFGYAPESPARMERGDVPSLSLAEFKRKLIDALKEYMNSSDADEAARCIRELDSEAFHYEVVKRAITLAMDAREQECELTSRLISFLYGERCLTTEQIGKGFERLFECIDDLSLDIPDAATMVAKFLARAVIDEALPPSFLCDYLVESLGGEVVDHAKVLLSSKHAMTRIANIWGPGTGRPVEELKQQMDDLLQEYLVSSDHLEASRCLRSLNARWYHHELPKRAVVIALDKDEPQRRSVMDLLSHLHATQTVTAPRMLEGFEKIRVLLGELTLDTPAAPQILMEFIRSGVENGYLSKEYEGKVAAFLESTETTEK